MDCETSTSTALQPMRSLMCAIAILPRHPQQKKHVHCHTCFLLLSVSAFLLGPRLQAGRLCPVTWQRRFCQSMLLTQAEANFSWLQIDFETKKQTSKNKTQNRTKSLVTRRQPFDVIRYWNLLNLYKYKRKTSLRYCFKRTGQLSSFSFSLSLRCFISPVVFIEDSPDLMHLHAPLNIQADT